MMEREEKRKVKHYRPYLTLSALDAIRMQFNCDGTHIVSSEDYQRFVEENL